MYGTYEKETNEVYEADKAPIISSHNPTTGLKIRFVYPENSNDIESTIRYLTLNKIYTIKKIMKKNDVEYFFTLEEIGGGVYFNSSQFINISYYTVNAFSMKYIKYRLKKIKKKIYNFFNRGYEKL